MDKNAIKKYAIRARNELIEKVKSKAQYYEIDENVDNYIKTETLKAITLSEKEKRQRDELIDAIKEKGYEEIIEEIAYTWFNRFSAIRFMEVNGYIPSKVRVLSSQKGEFKPEILDEALTIEIEGLDREKVFELKEKSDNKELYKYLLITQINSLNKILPGIFEKIDDYTELLLPDNLLQEESVIKDMVENIDEDDWKEIEIIGWLFQYYNSEKKEKIIDFKSSVINKNDVPAATQIFTTDWVVKYIIDNSLGRYWIERNPNSNLKETLDFFITPKNEEIEYIQERIEPTQITYLDNAMGSGHFCIYAFDVFIEIYKECGYSERDSAKLIIENNIFGLDIDERAYQLAYFAIMMKAMQYDRRILTRNIKPNINVIKESNNINNSITKYFHQENQEIKKEIELLIDTMKDAKEYGSIIKIPDINFDILQDRITEIKNDTNPLKYNTLEKLKPLIDIAKMLYTKYTIVATNPPYLNKYDAKLKKYVNENYKQYSKDLFSIFIYKNFDFCKPDGYSGFMTPNVWMFIKNYEELRKYIVNNKQIVTLIQMAKGAFFKEATVDIAAFVLGNKKKNQKGKYIRLEDFKGDMEVQKEKTIEAIKNKECGYYYETNEENFSKIPGNPIAYWASNKIIEAFEKGISMEKALDVKQGLATANNDRFLRLWWEVDKNKCKYNSKNLEDFLYSKKKWVPYNKGGPRRQWYGNYDYLVNWENNGYEIKNFKDENGKQRSVVRNPEYHFRDAITWTDITSGGFSIRYRISGGIHDVTGMSAFYNMNIGLKYILGLMGTQISNYIFKLVNPTIHLQIGDFKKFPLLYNREKENYINSIVTNNIEISKQDWDMNETSWDFTTHYLVKPEKIVDSEQLIMDRKDRVDSEQLIVDREKTIEEQNLTTNHYKLTTKNYELKTNNSISNNYKIAKSIINSRFEKLKANEEELNRIFIEIYGLQEELTPEISDKDITVAKVFDSKEEIYDDIKGNKYILTKEDMIKSLISYAIGCILGRYSPYIVDSGQLILDREKTMEEQNLKTNNYLLTTKIIPICEDEYFEDDIVVQFVDFIKEVYGEETLDENLKFIAEGLGGKGHPKEVIRKYFINDFYKDHCKLYQKCPIYWQFESGKNNAFKCLIYMHKYSKDTIARIRTDYVHEIQERYRSQLKDVQNRLALANGTEKVRLTKEQKSLQTKIEEMKAYEEQIHHLADQMIEIDLDDGVKVNYQKFEKVLSKI